MGPGEQVMVAVLSGVGVGMFGTGWGGFACVPEVDNPCIPGSVEMPGKACLPPCGAVGHGGQGVSAPCLTCQLPVQIPPPDSCSLLLLEAGFIRSQG